MWMLVVTLVAAGTLAFGAVYPWGYAPLFGAAAAMGVWGLWRGGLAPRLRPLAGALLVVWLVGAAQLVPLPRSLVDRLSPAVADISTRYSLVASGASGSLPLSIDPARTRTALLALGALSLYLLGVSPWLGGAGLRALPRAMAWFAGPLAVFGIYNWENTNNLVYWFWEPLERARANVFGPFISRNHYGGWMLMTICLLVGWLFGSIERTPRGRHARRSRTVAWLSSAEANGMVLMVVALVVCAVSIFWTLSRSSMLGFGAATLAFTWLALTRRRLGTGRKATGVALLSAVLLAAVVWRGPVRLLEWFQDNNLASRLDAWRDGWDVIRAFPWTGTGLNTYGVAMFFYQSRNREYYMNAAHNDYVQLLAESGVVGAAAAAVAIAVLIRAIRQNLLVARAEARGYWIRAGAAVGLVTIAIQETLEFSLQVPVNALLFCTLAAIALAPVTAASAARSHLRGNIQERPGSADVSLS